MYALAFPRRGGALRAEAFLRGWRRFLTIFSGPILLGRLPSTIDGLHLMVRCEQKMEVLLEAENASPECTTAVCTVSNAKSAATRIAAGVG